MVLPPLTPELNVSSLERSLEFYVGVLGFEVAFERPEERFAAIGLDGAFLMLDEMKETHAVTDKEFVEDRAWRTGEVNYPYGRGMNFLITVKDIEGMYQRISDSKFTVKVPMEEKWYRVKDKEVGVKQFLILDPDGFLLRFDCDFGTRSVQKNI